MTREQSNLQHFQHIAIIDWWTTDNNHESPEPKASTIAIVLFLCDDCNTGVVYQNCFLVICLLVSQPNIYKYIHYFHPMFCLCLYCSSCRVWSNITLHCTVPALLQTISQRAVIFSNIETLLHRVYLMGPVVHFLPMRLGFENVLQIYCR